MQFDVILSPLRALSDRTVLPIYIAMKFKAKCQNCNIKVNGHFLEYVVKDKKLIVHTCHSSAFKLRVIIGIV